MFILIIFLIMGLTISTTFLINKYLNIKIDRKKSFIILLVLITFSIGFFLIHNNYVDLVLALILVSLFCVIFYVDLKIMIIPELLNLLIFLISFIHCILSLVRIIPSIYHHYFDIIWLYIFLIIVFIINLYISRKYEIMGFGDLKFFLAIGFLIGIYYFFILLFLSCFLALIIEGIFFQFKRKIIPFGPYLVFGMIIILLFYPYINILLNVFIY